MEIAIGVYGDGLVIAQTEGYVGLFTGLEVLALTAVFGLDIDPFDVVFIGHRMIDAADIDIDHAALNGYGGPVLLVAGFNSIGICSSIFFPQQTTGTPESLIFSMMLPQVRQI